jgi:type II secretory ATPase GspE/PulE/Tfp pilus assembly ATPase PilB-like protein
MNTIGRIAPAGARRAPIGRRPRPAGPGNEPDSGASAGVSPAVPNGPVELRAPDVAGLRPERAVAALIDHAVRIGASDLFFSFNDNHVAASVRHLGMIRLVTVLTTEHGRRCVSYIKAMADMDLAEQRRPLDGRWVREDDTFLFGDTGGDDETGDDEDEDDEGDDEPVAVFARPPARAGAGRIDLRVSTIPTLHGEDMAIRLLVSTPQVVALDQLGMSRRELNEVAAMLDIPGGLILVSGPTGSGKTTTLYAGLRHLNTGARKIHTIEDPIEYVIPGLRQSQINPKADVGFAELLRSVLRQAPDVILVGEIRDAITAEIAIRAANSGHLVLASVHAPSAPGAVQSLLALGVSPHFLSGALNGVIAQRLVRTLCPNCKVPFELDEAPGAFEEVRAWLEPGEGRCLFGARGCAECLGTGYSGRTGVFEVLRINRELRRLIADGRPTGELRDAALRAGLLDLRRAALLKLARGQTNAEEVLRTIPPEDLGLDE